MTTARAIPAMVATQLFLAGLFFTGLSMAGGPHAALAGVQDFTLINDTGYPLRAVYVSPSDQESWQEDILGDEVLEDEGEIELQFERSESECLWDMKVVYDDDGSASVWQELDLCAYSVITIRYDRATDRSTAVVQ